MYLSQSSTNKQSEHLLISKLVHGILRGISNRVSNKRRINYNNIITKEDTFCGKKVHNIYTNIRVTEWTDGTESNCIYNNVWLASIPRMDDDGMFTVDGLRYYVVMRQRLICNTPTCFTMRGDKSGSIECVIRSENFDTLESISISMLRQLRSPNRIVLSPNIKDMKPLDVIGYIKALLNHDNWRAILTFTLKLLRCSVTVISLIQILFNGYEENHSARILFPSCIDINTGKCYDVNIGEYEVTADYVMVVQMLAKFVGTECGEIKLDDINDFSNKLIDSYSVMMGKLFRKMVIKMGGNITLSTVVDHPRLHSELVDAITNNKWQVLEEYNDELRISRLLETPSEMGIEASLTEVITLAGSHTSEASISTDYSLRMLHPSQCGYLCIIRTSDDINAGLKSYLASDCLVSSHNSLMGFENIEGLDDVSLLRIEYYSRMSKANIYAAQNIQDAQKDLPPSNVESNTIFNRNEIVIWTHNSVPIVIGTISLIMEILDDTKRNKDRTIGWSVCNGIVESRCYYGRLMCKCHTDLYGHSYVDSREMNRLKNNITVAPSLYSKLCHEIPYKNMMPVPRTMLTAKILQKSIPCAPPLIDTSTYIHLGYSHKPMVVTSKCSNIYYGNNVVVCYTTLQGRGVEDGIIVNESAVARGLFSTIQKITMEWVRDEEQDITIKEFTINVKRHSEVKEGLILATITYEENDGKIKSFKLRHTKPFSCRVSDIFVSFSKHKSFSYAIVPRNLMKISISLMRYKRFCTGDKLSSRFGQKSVAVCLMKEEDMPYVADGGNHSRFGGIDIIINPLSIISRCTVSQELSSTLGLLGLQVGAESIVDTPFSGTEIVYGKSGGATEPININSLHSTKVSLIDGVTGEQRSGLSTIGMEYYMVLNHIADTKVRSKGAISRDDITGTPISSKSDTCVRYNWQELSALLHGESYSLASHIFNDTGVRGAYPYCRNCSRVVDSSESNSCEYCDLIIDSKVLLSRSFMASRCIIRVLGGDMVIHANDK